MSKIVFHAVSYSKLLFKGLQKNSLVSLFFLAKETPKKPKKTRKLNKQRNVTHQCGVTFGGYLAKILSFKTGNLLNNSKFHLLSDGTVSRCFSTLNWFLIFPALIGDTLRNPPLYFDGQVKHHIQGRSDRFFTRIQVI